MGVALPRGSGLLLLLRDALTRADKIYRFDEMAPPPAEPKARTFAGHGFDQQFRAGARKAALVSLDVVALQVEEQ